MFAGFAEIDITPPVGTLMPGGFDPVPSEGVWHNIYSNAAAFTQGENSVILISMEILSSKPWYTDGIRKRISEATGVPAKNILISAIHNHTGPALEYQLWLCAPNVELAEKIADLTVEVGIKAWENREEAKMGVGHCTDERFSTNRDYYMTDGKVMMNPNENEPEKIFRVAGPVDYSVDVMRVDDQNGNVKAFLVNYANHACCNTRETSKMLSADYPGFLRSTLKKKFGEDVKVLFFAGTSGDINCFDPLTKRHHAYRFNGKLSPQLIGEGLAEDVEKLNPTIKADIDAPQIDVVSQYCTTSRRFKSEEDVKWAQEIAKDMQSHGSMSRAFATEYLDSDEGIPKEVDIEVQTIRLGPWAIVGLPSEIYTELGLRIKWASPFEHTLIFSLANGTHGYIPPAYIVRSATYEAKVSKYNSYCGEETAEKLVNQSIDQLVGHYRKELGLV